MALDYSEIKGQAIELKASLEKINKEAVSFKDAREALDKVSEKLAETCEHMEETAGNSVKLIDEVQSIAVEDTVAMLRNSTDAIIASNEETKNIIEDAVSSVETSTVELADTVTNAVAEMQKKMIVMGAISIVCAIAAVVIAIAL